MAITWFLLGFIIGLFFNIDFDDDDDDDSKKGGN